MAAGPAPGGPVLELRVHHGVEGARMLAVRPTLSDYVLKMRRGAQVVYPKDTGPILVWGDVFPGAVVIESGVGPGALTIALLRAIGESGRLVSYEQREDFAQMARTNVARFVGETPQWTLRIGDVYDGIEEQDVDRVILEGITLAFFPGAKIGVLGLNGSGKSTLLNIMAGVEENYEGEVIRMPGIRVGHLPQEPRLNPKQTVRESVEEAQGDVAAARKRLDEVYAAYSEPDADFEKLAEEQARLEALVNASDSQQLEIAADALRLPPWEQKVEVLSGGEKRRVALCRLLLSNPDLLLLDEPTNHLDAESVEWLEQFLLRFPGTVVAVTHDRYFLDNAAGWILELDRGRGIPWEGNYSSWLEQKEKRLQVEASQEAARIRSMQAELEWVRQNPKGRRAKSKARLARFEELSQYEHQQRNETQEIFIPVAERLGNEVIEFEGVSKGFGERLLVDKLSFKVPPGAIVGIIGPNGAGKSTLLKVVARVLRPTTGRVRVRGRVAPLLELGAGFDLELTGRENVFLNGAILGMKRTEIQRKFDEIVAFAEIDEFLDTPVKHFSSGMYMRLAFSGGFRSGAVKAALSRRRADLPAAVDRVLAREIRQRIVPDAQECADDGASALRVIGPRLAGNPCGRLHDASLEMTVGRLMCSAVECGDARETGGVNGDGRLVSHGSSSSIMCCTWQPRTMATLKLSSGAARMAAASLACRAARSRIQAIAWPTSHTWFASIISFRSGPISRRTISARRTSSCRSRPTLILK